MRTDESIERMSDSEIHALLEFVRVGTIAPRTAVRLLAVKGQAQERAEALVAAAVAEGFRPKRRSFLGSKKLVT